MQFIENGHKLLLLIVLILLSFTATAEVYKWVDENGKVHYSDKPINQNSKQLKIQDNISPEQQRKAQQEAKARLERQQKRIGNIMASEKEEKKRAEKAQKQAAKKDRYCAHIREQLAMLKMQTRIYEVNKKGERVYMEDERREREKLKLERQLTQQCSD